MAASRPSAVDASISISEEPIKCSFCNATAAIESYTSTMGIYYRCPEGWVIETSCGYDGDTFPGNEAFCSLDHFYAYKRRARAHRRLRELHLQLRDRLGLIDESRALRRRAAELELAAQPALQAAADEKIAAEMTKEFGPDWQALTALTWRLP